MAETRTYAAPGRTEIIGNHCDHQHGCVIAAAIDREIHAEVIPTDSLIVNLQSEGYAPLEIDLRDLSPKEDEKGTTAALIRGVASYLSGLGLQLHGFDASVRSEVPSGSGVSSSAAFEVLIGAIFADLAETLSAEGTKESGRESSDFGKTKEQVSAKDSYSFERAKAQVPGRAPTKLIEGDGRDVKRITPEILAMAGQFAENEYFGKPSGLMDQMACAGGGFSYIDFEDPSHPVLETIPFDPEEYGYSLCLVNTGSSHADLTDAYASIPAEMSRVAKCFGKQYLRQVTPEEFWAEMPVVRKKCGDRALLRAVHFFNENERVLLAKEALSSKNIHRFLQLIDESGRSSYELLQNIWAGPVMSGQGRSAQALYGQAESEDTVSVQSQSGHDVYEQDLAVALMLSREILQDKGASRVHGGGFAGTIQVYVPFELKQEYQTQMELMFGEGCCHFMSVSPHGARRIS